MFSVLASSDQVFSFYYLGENSVDTFDIHPLTKYYYYLRKWLLKNGMNLCPSEYDDYFLKDMVRKIEPRFKEEKLSKIF